MSEITFHRVISLMANVLTPKQEHFLCEYLSNGRDGRSAYRSSYDAEKMSNESVDREVKRLLAHPLVAPQVAQVIQKAVLSRVITMEWVLDRLRIESEREGKGAHHGARISALREIAAILLRAEQSISPDELASILAYIRDTIAHVVKDRSLLRDIETRIANYPAIAKARAAAQAHAAIRSSSPAQSTNSQDMATTPGSHTSPTPVPVTPYVESPPSGPLDAAGPAEQPAEASAAPADPPAGPPA